MTTRDWLQPQYQQIAAEIAERIDCGELVDGNKLPTRPELQERYGVSQQVIRDALTNLHQAGYLRSAPGPSGGTFVRRLPLLTLPMYVLEAEHDDRAVDAFISAVQDAHLQGREHRAHQDIRVETAVPNAAIAEYLQLPADDLVTVRRRVRYVDGIPYALADSYFPHRLVAGSPLAEPADIPTGGRHVMRQLGIGMDSHHDIIGGRRPHQAEIQTLDVAPGMPMISHTRVSLTDQALPVRVMISILPADRWQVTYSVSK